MPRIVPGTATNNKHLINNLMEAEITFPDRNAAYEFAKHYSRKTLRGHTISAGMTNVTVEVYGLSELDKNWIDNYVKKLNEYYEQQ